MGNGKKYTLITYGCQMNDYDSAVMAGLLEAHGWCRVEEPRDADLVVVNTCSVRRTAEDRAIGRITQLNRIKRHRNPDMVLCFTGCVAQEWGEQLQKRFPFIDLVIGTRDFVGLPRLVEEVRAGGEPIVATDSIEAALELGVPHTLQKHSIRAGVTVIYGCNNYCSYCIVPYVRGREQSRHPEEIVAEVAELVRRGYKEIILLGQNVNAYHYNGIDFAELLARVNDVQGVERIRFVTSHPRDSGERLFDAIASLEHVCEHLHVPFQSGSTKILERMNRKYTREEYLRLVGMARARVPDIALTTDIIVGFPGETEHDFEQTLALVRGVRFDSAFTFFYTPRPHTYAAEKFVDDVSLHVKKERLKRLIELQESISAEKNEALIGTAKEVLVEGTGRKGGSQRVGRTRGDKMVAFEGDEYAPGQVVHVAIREAWRHTLFGEISSRADTVKPG